MAARKPHENDEPSVADPSARAREGLEHLQAAARELIAAARAVLDVAEELVNDPETVSTVVGAVSGLVQAAGRAAAAGTGAAGGAGPATDHVERIRVS